jgi:regulator of RNase E activity RraA
MSIDIAPPLDADVLARLGGFDTPTLANALDSLDLRPATTGFTRPPLHGVLPSLPPIVGFAVTVTICTEPPFADAAARRDAMLPLYAAVAAAPGPQLIVVRDSDQGAGCLWGEVNATICSRLGAVGVVTDGLVRDLPAVEGLGFACVARGVGVARANTRVVSTGEPVDVGGLHVEAGDLVHADRHGALQIPIEAVGDVLDAADAISAREARLLTWVGSPEFRPDELAARRARH